MVHPNCGRRSTTNVITIREQSPQLQKARETCFSAGVAHSVTEAQLQDVWASESSLHQEVYRLQLDEAFRNKQLEPDAEAWWNYRLLAGQC